MLAYLRYLPTCWLVISTLISVQSLLITQLDQPRRNRVTPAALYPYRMDSLVKTLKLSTLISFLCLPFLHRFLQTVVIIIIVASYSYLHAPACIWRSNSKLPFSRDTGAAPCRALVQKLDTFQILAIQTFRLLRLF